MRRYLVALPGLEPGLSALRGRRVNQLHHNAIVARRRMLPPVQPQLYQPTIRCSTRPGGPARLQAQLLDLVVVVLAVKDLPLLRSLQDDFALRRNLLSSIGV